MQHITEIYLDVPGGRVFTGFGGILGVKMLCFWERKRVFGMAKYVKLKTLDNANLSGDQDLHFFCKYLSASSGSALQDDVNAWLLSLESIPEIQFAFLSSQYVFNEEDEKHECWLSMAAIGDIPIP